MFSRSCECVATSAGGDGGGMREISGVCVSLLAKSGISTLLPVCCLFFFFFFFFLFFLFFPFFFPFFSAQQIIRVPLEPPFNVFLRLFYRIHAHRIQASSAHHAYWTERHRRAADRHSDSRWSLTGQSSRALDNDTKRKLEHVDVARFPGIKLRVIVYRQKRKREAEIKEE